MSPSWVEIGGEIHMNQSFIHLLANYFIKRPYSHVFLFTPTKQPRAKVTLRGVKNLSWLKKHATQVNN